MTIVEFFDNTSIDNIVSALLCQPDKVIFIGDNGKRMTKYNALYNDIISERNQTVDFSYKVVNRNNLENIVSVLSAIAEENEDCVFDLAGGEDLYLVAVGIVSERYSKVRLHRFNIRNNSLIDCDADGQPVNVLPMEISVEENIRIYAGKMISTFTNGFEWDFNDDFCSDIYLMWEMCKEDTKRWNRLGTVLTAFGEACFEEGSQKVVINRDTAGGSWQIKAKELNQRFLKRLAAVGLVNDLKITSEEISFSFKDEQIKRCITKAGQLLELYITITIKELKDKHGNKVYNDVQTGILIDWDGLEPSSADTDKASATLNEIDVVLMKGLVPVFISCKNGLVDVDEFYKLSVVAERFGGKYAKKVLLVSDLDASNANHKYLRARAEDMNIRIVDDVVDLPENELNRILASLWCN